MIKEFVIFLVAVFHSIGSYGQIEIDIKFLIVAQIQ
jgi:hypothetical protein